MKRYLCLPGESEIEYAILSHVAENPNIRDTIDGIVQWWLLEHKIKYQIDMVKRAIAELVKKGFLIEKKVNNSMSLYQINSNKYKEIQEFLKEHPGPGY